MLLPLAPETKVWQEYILNNAIIYIPNKRIRFISGDGTPSNGVSFTSVIVKLTKEPNNTYETMEI